MQVDDQIEWEKNEGDRLLASAKSIVGLPVRGEEELLKMGDRSFHSLRRTLADKRKFHNHAAESILTQTQRLILWAYCRRVDDAAKARTARGRR